MLRLSEIERVVASGNCMGCGFCTVSARTGRAVKGLTIAYSQQHDYFVPHVAPEAAENEGSEERVYCPGEEMNMVELATAKHGGVPDDYMLGQVRGIRVSYSTNERYRRQSASGGFVPQALDYLFSKGLIEVAYALVPGPTPGSAQGMILRGVEDIEKIHGSAYHPTRFGVNLAELFALGKTFAFVGLPCEIAALEQLKRSNPSIAAKHRFSIGIFCGGINKFGGIAYYLRSFGVRWPAIANLEYRHGPWPGRIRIDYKDGQQGSAPNVIPRIRGNTRWKILRYVIAFQGYWMLRRCRICPDQVADFADIAVGDPHLPKYRKQENWGYSLVVARSEAGEALVREMERERLLESEVVDRETAIRSQGYTLDNRRHVAAYLRVNERFGNHNPAITQYPEAARRTSFRHYVYAVVDLGKIQLSKWPWLSIFYVPWQVFEYLFITLTPSVIVDRIKKLVSNK